jgi:crotonobetainyl-CoA:carnitine CoA-transferase CaiB-like acyl-CoA transferase
MMLGDLGADVIKIERPQRGDDTRSWGPPFWGKTSAAFLSFNRNKKSVVLDIKHPEGQRILKDLVGRADILVHNLRAGTLERLGFGYEEVRAQNKSIIYCAMSAYGSSGPMSGDPGYDVLMQAFSGLMSITGEPGRPPVRSGMSVVDMGMGMWGVIGIMGALMHRRETGEGQLVETSLFETALSWIPYQIMGFLGTGEVPQRYGSGLPMLAPYEAYPTSDGMIVLAVGNDSQWGKFCRVTKLAELLEDPRFADNPSRVRHREALFQHVSAQLKGKSTAAWVDVLGNAGVPCSPIQSIDQVVSHPQTKEVGIMREVNHPEIPGYTEVGLPVRWDGRRPETRLPPPRLGADTREVLRELGRSDDDIQQLIDAKVIEEPSFVTRIER